MSQNDYTIANQSAPDFRSDLNDALQALASLSSGSSAPSTTYANMLWYDTSNNILKMRTEADDAWINVGYLDQSANAFRILDDTQVVNTSGTQTGLLGDQSEATWIQGTSTTEGLVSPAKIKAAIEANAGGGGLVLLGTLTTTSGTTQTLSGLDLTGYKYLRISFDGVSHDSGGLAGLQIDGKTVSSSNVDSDQLVIGTGFLDLINGAFWGSVGRSDNATTAQLALTSYSTASTSISFSWNAGNFDAGEIRVYGES